MVTTTKTQSSTTTSAVKPTAENSSFLDQPLMELRGISKRYPGVLALDDMNFQLRSGEVHVLFGENGAGKSTLISIVAGVHEASEGEILFRGTPVKLESVQHARLMGISAVFQEFSLVDQLTVEQNLFLGSEQTTRGLLNRRVLHDEAERILKRLGFGIKSRQKIAYLSRAEQQMVEIAKAFRSDLSVLILDEPTASLTDHETNRLFELINQVKAQGVGIIYITHRLAEIRRIADRVTVLRDGKYVDTVDAKKVEEGELVQLMTGRVIDQVFPKVKFNPGVELLKIQQLSTTDGRVNNASMVVRRGEIVGMAGLVGAGKSKMIRACFGLEPLIGGDIVFDDENVNGKSTREMLDRGFFYVPPDRRAEGLVMVRNCRENISVSSLHLPEYKRWTMLRRKQEKQLVFGLAKKMDLQPLNIEREVDHFSGGNQQKVMLAKCLTGDVKLFVFDEPTVGVDVGTRVEIYKFIAQLCENGAAVIMISSDLNEVLHLSHRLYVMYRGAVQAELCGDDITQQNVLRNFFDQEAA